MARIKNSQLEGLRGTLGDLVFRTWDGKTFVYLKPPKPVKQTTAQKANRMRFSQASLRVMEMLTDDKVRAYYALEAARLNLPNAYTAALREQLLIINR